MADSEILLVLRPFAAFPTVDDLAIRSGWKHVESFGRTDTQFMEEIWEVDGAAAIVRYIDDHFVRAIYLSVSGKQRDRTAQFILENLDTIPQKELWRDARSANGKNREQAIRFLTAIIEEYNPDLAEILDDAADDPHPEVRNAALLGIGRVAWPELWPVVRRRYEREEDPYVRAQAEALFVAYRKHLGQTEGGSPF